ncbi:Probable glucuronoxylan glucuronosyltransferase F8H [Linum perenne]
MIAVQKWKCSWSLIAAIASAVALVSIVSLFLFPVDPSFDYLRIREATQTGCVLPNGTLGRGTGHVWPNLQPTVDLHLSFPVDLHGAVVYRKAPWKAEIGRWLSGCDSNAKEATISEIIGGRGCKDDCNGQGVCNYELGKCRCFHGYGGDLTSVCHIKLLINSVTIADGVGEGCFERMQLTCNHPTTPEQPYGRWVVSICATHCDTTRAMCFCGEGTKYPNRPVAEACGFQVNLPVEPNAPKLTDWTKDDLENIFTTNISKAGWCNVDPAEAYASRVKFKEECDCKYDGLSGRFCEVPVESVCINQCSGHGHCRGGFCQCRSGWYGIDCSIPSVLSPLSGWPRWLHPSQLNIPENENGTTKLFNLNTLVKKKRPLVYIYDLPPEFNSLLLEGRHFKLECVNRIYDDKNATIWTDQLYGSQIAMYESLLASSHRTLNGEEADFFYVPVLDSCIITRADDAPHLSLEEHRGIRSSFTLEIYRKAYDHIVEHYPYWNRSMGRDHIWSFSWDEGACYAPKEIWNSMMLVHWGNTNSKHNHSTTAYWADNWNNITSDRRGTHPCFDPDKDLVLPSWKRPDASSLRMGLWARPLQMRKTLFYFNGNLGPAYEYGRPEASYSLGIRQKLAEEFGSSPNKDGKLGKQHVDDVIVTPMRTENYHVDLASSVFCGVLPGDGWSGRMEDSILQGCIPVVIQDGIFLPYENVLNYDSFAVRIQEDEIPNLIKVLRAFNDTEIKFKLRNVQKVWQRFVYRDSLLLEAERQKTELGFVADWAVQILKLTGDDVFTTFLQILHYKLHNDPWREHVGGGNKEFGVPRECLREGRK